MPNVWKPVKKGEKKTYKFPAWDTSTIDMILNNNRRVLGELQLNRYTKENGKRVNVPDGDPIPNFYGKGVIEKELFNSVQNIIRENSKKDGRGGGRGDLVNSLFTHMAVCVCGYPMHYLNKGNETRTSDHFKCAKATQGYNCEWGSAKLHYGDVEQAVLLYCKGLDVAELMPNSETAASELSILQSQVQAKEAEIKLLTDQMDGNIAAQKAGKNPAYLKALEHSWVKMDKEKEKLEDEKKPIEIRIEQLTGNGKQTEEQLKDIRDLIEKMQTLEGQERLQLRLRLRSQLRRLIDLIKVDSVNKWIMIYFHGGQRRVINLVTMEVRADIYPDSIFHGIHPKE